MRIVGTLLLVIVLAVAGLFVFIYSGIYNIAASESHWGAVEWILEETMENSVRAHASDTKAPALDKQDKKKGFDHFDKLCVTCNGAPGVYPSEIGTGLNPEPPELSEHAKLWSAAELFWITKHGLKMTGMPAFGKTHTADDLWDIVAFLKELPHLSPEEYQKLSQPSQRPDQPHGHSGLPLNRDSIVQRAI